MVVTPSGMVTLTTCEPRKARGPIVEIPAGMVTLEALPVYFTRTLPTSSNPSMMLLILQRSNARLEIVLITLGKLMDFSEVHSKNASFSMHSNSVVFSLNTIDVSFLHPEKSWFLITLIDSGKYTAVIVLFPAKAEYDISSTPSGIVTTLLAPIYLSRYAPTMQNLSLSAMPYMALVQKALEDIYFTLLGTMTFLRLEF